MFDPSLVFNVVQTIPVVRDAIKIIRGGNNSQLSTKHLVIKSTSTIKQFIDNEFIDLYEDLYSRRIFLKENEVFNELSKIIRNNDKINNYDSWEETPVSHLKEKSVNMVNLDMDISKLLRLSEKHDLLTYSITKSLLSNEVDINPKNFCEHKFFFEGCSECVREVIEFRPNWHVLLWIENLNDEPVTLHNYNGQIYYPHNRHGIRKDYYGTGEEFEREFPIKTLQKGESVLIPEFILLAPINIDKNVEETKLVYDEIENYYGYNYEYEENHQKNDFYLVGPSMSIEEININGKNEPIHKFSVNNMLTVSKTFNVGSCPYVLGFKNDKWHYIKDILTFGKEKINIEGFKKIIIAEIEDEITHLYNVIAKNKYISKVIIENKILKEKDIILLDNLENYIELIIDGYYVSRNKYIDQEDIIYFKYQNIKKLLNNVTL